MNITFARLVAKLPIEQIGTTIRQYLEPLTSQLPDKRLGRVAELLLLGIVGGQTPVITAMARHRAKDEGETWAVAKRIYRWLGNERLTSQALFASLYQIGQHTVALERPKYLVVAVDPVNFEKPYVEALEGVRVVHKATPPGCIWTRTPDAWLPRAHGNGGEYTSTRH